MGRSKLLRGPAWSTVVTACLAHQLITSPRQRPRRTACSSASTATPWDTPSARRRGAFAAYNRFLPATDPKSGETVWLCGTWVERPGSPNPPDNGACYLIRHRNGTYDWGYVRDLTDPVPAGQRLTGTRDIEPSPLPAGQGQVFYFCGYDGGSGPGHNTAWVYRGEVSHLKQPTTERK